MLAARLQHTRAVLLRSDAGVRFQERVELRHGDLPIARSVDLLESGLVGVQLLRAHILDRLIPQLRDARIQIFREEAPQRFGFDQDSKEMDGAAIQGTRLTRPL